MLAAACGKSNSSPTSPSGGSGPLTQAQITTVSAAVGPGISLALSALDSALSNAVLSVGRKKESVHIEATTTPIAASQACGGGGTVSVSGSVVNGTTINGGGSVTINMAIGYSNCTENSVRLQGNPNLTMGGAINFSNFAPVSPVTFTTGGGLLFTLNGTTGSMAFDCTDKVDAATFFDTQSGNVTLQYPRGENNTTVACSAF
jgi:hypothetical protein